MQYFHGDFRILLFWENELVNEPVNLVLEILKNNPSISKEKLVKEINKSRSTVSRVLSNLKEKRIIQRIGSDKNGHYKVIKK